MMKNWQIGALLGVVVVGMYALMWLNVLSR